MKLFGPNINRMLQRKDFAGLTEALNHKKAPIRRSSAIGLGQLGKTEALLPLMHAFVKEPETSVREAILKSLTLLFTSQALNPMVHALADKNNRVQILAGKLLAQVNYQATGPAFRNLLDDEAVDILIEKLNHSDTDVSNASAGILSVMGNRAVSRLVADLQYDRMSRTGNVARILGWIKNPNAIEPLVKVLGFSGLASQGAVEALEEFGAQAIVPLRIAMRSGNAEARKNAISLLQKAGDTELMEPLSKSLDDSAVCYEAALALAHHGQAAFSILLGALEDRKKPWKRAAACKGLGNLGILEASPNLILALDDENSSVRAEAALALGKLKYSDAVPSLLLAMGDRDHKVVSNAIKALEELNEQQLVKAIQDAKHGKPEKIIKLNDSRAIPVLLDILGNSRMTTRDGALKALHELGQSSLVQAFTEALVMKPEALISLNDERIIRVLVQLVLQGTANEKKAAAFALGKWSVLGFDALVELIHTEVSSVQQAVVFGLGQSGEESALPHLLNVLEDESQANYYLRGEAALALGRLGDSSALDSLKVAAKTDNTSVRQSALIAIAQLSPDAAWQLIQEEPNGTVRQAVFHALTPEQIVGYVSQTKNNTIVQDMLIGTTSSGKIDLEVFREAGVTPRFRESILSHFEGEVWNKVSANQLVQLIPESSITVEMIDWMDKALGYQRRYTGAKYEYGELDIALGTSAIKALCIVKTPATSNLLHIIGNKKDISVTLDKGCGNPVIRELDFSSQRQLALTELEERGNPPYNVYNFVDGEVSEVDIQKGESLIRIQVYQDLIKRATDPSYRFRTQSDPMSAYRALVKDHPTEEVLQIIAADVAKRERMQESQLRAYESLLIEGGKSLPIEQAMGCISMLQYPWPQAYTNIRKALQALND